MYNISCERYFNTWNSKSPAIMEFLPARFTIVPGAYSFASGEYTEFPFSDKIKLYEHDHEGRYLRLTMEHAGTVLQLCYWKADNWTVRGRLELLQAGEWGLRFLPTLAFGFEAEGVLKIVDAELDFKQGSYHLAVAFKDRPIRQCLAEKSSYLGEEMVKNGYYSPFTDADEAKYLNSCFNLEESPVIDFAVAVTNHPRTASKKAKEALDLSEEELAEIELCLEEALSMEGPFSSCASALRDVMSWNNLADHYNNRVLTSLTRFWIDKKFGGWFLWLDDVFYHALISAWSGDWETSENNLKAALDNAVPAGNLACLMSAFSEWVDRSQPPVFSFIVWKYYQLTQDTVFIRRAFPSLLRAHNWWFEKRDGNQNQLLEYGSSKDCGDGHFKQTKLACKDEAAMDNSPMFDRAVYVPEAETMDMEDIALNSLLVLDAESLLKMAEVLGQKEIARKLAKELELHKAKINQNLWDEERSIYANRLWSGEFSSPSPTSFYPLAAGIPDKERADLLIKHIFAADEFWTKAPLPSIWLKDEAVHNNVYWRGRMWPPLNFFCYLGLKRYGYDKEARRLALKCAEIFTAAFENERACYENYNCFTGEGKSVDSDPFYGWGALLPLIWILEHVDSTDDGGLDFGAGDLDAMKIKGIKTSFGLVDLDLAETSLVKIDGEIVFTATTKGRFKNFVIRDNYARVTVSAQKKRTSISFAKINALLVHLNGKEIEASSQIELEQGLEQTIEIWF